MSRNDISILCLTLLICIACTSRESNNVTNIPTVKIATLEATSNDVLLQYPGKVMAAQDVALSFRVSGVLERILTQEGSYVGKGQLLAELDDTDYKVQLSAAEAEYKQVKAEAERVIALYRDSGTTANAYDKAIYGLRQIEAKYQHAQDELSYTKLYAPFSGYVQKHLFDAHETVGAGLPVVMLISDETPEVEINISAMEYIRRSKFDAFRCTFDVYPSVEYPLQLISISPKANANQLYTMRLRLETTDRPQPSPGMNTMVTICCKSETEVAYMVPTTALVHENGQSSLFVFSPTDSIVHSVDVTVVRLFSDGRSLVTSNALRVGDQIVTSGAHHISDGQNVRPMSEASDTNVGGLL